MPPTIQRPTLLVLDDAMATAIASLGTFMDFPLVRVGDFYEVSPDTARAYHLELQLLKEEQYQRSIYEACLTVASQALAQSLGEGLKDWLRGDIRLGKGKGCKAIDACDNAATAATAIQPRRLSIGTVTGRSKVYRYGKVEIGRPTVYQYEIEVEVRL